MTTAELVFHKMYDLDWFSQWLGIECLEVGEGFCTLRMQVRKEMLNGFGIAHGGITYSLADSALAFASNSLGRKAVSIETSISHTRQLHEGDTITAIARQEHVSNKLGVYKIDVKDEKDQIVALFKGMVYRTSVNWET